MQNIDILKGIASLNSLKSNLDKDSFYTHEKYIKEYHDFINTLQSKGFEVDSFRIPEEEITSRVSSSSPTGGVKYRPYKEVETKLFFYKMDALTNFLNPIMKPPEGGSMGFNQ